MKLQTGLVFKSRLGMTGWNDARLSEVDFRDNMGFFIKIDGENNKSGKTEQVQIWLNEQDAADLVALLTKLMLQKGGTCADTLKRFLELRQEQQEEMK